MLRRLLSLIFTVIVTLMTAPAAAEVTRIVVLSRSPLFDGRAFGAVGAYEEIKGIAYGELDPRDPANALITDIAFAPRNSRGVVEYRTTFTLRKPVDMTHAPGVLMYGIVNRGNRGEGLLLVGGDPGDGLLYRLGHAMLWSGWQGDLPGPEAAGPREGIAVPVAKNADGSSITGRVWARFVGVPGNVSTATLPGAASRVPLTLDTLRAQLVSARSETPDGVKSGVTTIASSDWAFADCRTTAFPGTPDPTRVCLRSGFDPALLYELAYTAKDPLVLGVGMAAVRDVVSFIRYATADSIGTANPGANAFRYVVATGVSQSGRFAKAFLNLGFNRDERGRIVWDGLNASIAASLGGFNTRFAQPGDIAELYDPGTEASLWWGDYADTVRGRPSTGLLHRCTATNTCPKITETYGGPEMWYTRASAGIAGTSGTRDLPLPANVRRYYYSGTPHGGGPGGFLRGVPPTTPGTLAANPNPQRDTDRALYVALVDWVVNGTLPPPSAYPRVGDGTLVRPTAVAMGWPKIPGVPSPEGVVNPLLDYDYGPEFRYADNSGVITRVPPVVRRVLPTLVPRVDMDGNEVAGVRSLLARVPLGTYVSWNPIATGPLRGRERALATGYVPFALTKAERTKAGDPRLSIEERYPSFWAYYSAAQAQADELVRERFLLPEDAIRLMKQVLGDMEASGLFTGR